MKACILLCDGQPVPKGGILKLDEYRPAALPLSDTLMRKALAFAWSAFEVKGSWKELKAQYGFISFLYYTQQGLV